MMCSSPLQKNLIKHKVGFKDPEASYYEQHEHTTLLKLELFWLFHLRDFFNCVFVHSLLAGLKFEKCDVAYFQCKTICLGKC